jgi:hypothetical protein
MTRPRGGVTVAVMSVELYWIPLGAGGHVVAFNGRVFEALAAGRAHRPRRALYHAAQLMAEHDIAHLIVIEAGSPVGVVSTLDVARAASEA